MPRTTMNSQNSIHNTGLQNSTPSNPSSGNNTLHGNISERNTTSNVSNNVNPTNISLTQHQFTELLNSLQVRQEFRSTFSTCSARFNGGRNTSKVEDFIATILVYKDAERISDSMALTSLPLLLEGYASSWWQGVKHEARSFDEAIELLRSAFAPPKPDWRIYSEIFQDKQKSFESTDSFICRKRRLLAQLKERLPESTKINMIFSLINIKIREKIPRESIETFQDLLSKARDIEIIDQENKDPTQKQIEHKDVSQTKCSFCRKKNHTAEVCYKRLELEKKKKPEQTTLNCYGCGAVGFYRSNCPTCNSKTVLESPREMDFHSIQTNIVGHNVPTIEINVNGLIGEAYLDTAARTSIAGHYLYKKLLEKEVKFQTVNAEITLADGVARKEKVKATVVDILIGNRLKRIRFICLPSAKDNRTLLGIDFLEQAGIVMDLAQRTWYFKDQPAKIFEFKSKPSKVKDDYNVHHASVDNITNISDTSKINDFLSWFEMNNEVEPNNTSTPRSLYSGTSDYSPRGILEIFEDALPINFEMPREKKDNLFPPLKKKKFTSTRIFDLNAIDFNICDNDDSHLNKQQKEKLIDLLKLYKEIFENVCSPIKGIKHKINTGNSAPISNPPYRISPAMKEKLKIELKDMLSNGIIEERESPWAFPVVLIPKKNGSIRLCVDYRKLNAITVTDTYPLPRIEDLLHAAKTTPYMSTIDLRSGYWQVEMDEEDKLKTAFTTPFGIYVFNRMPFGLKNAPATFQRIVDKVKSSLPNVLILVYIDDIIICSISFENHLKDLDLTFKKLKSVGFHLNNEKCFFCKPKVKYLGHILTKDGIQVDPEKTSAIFDRPAPRNLKQLMSFLQTCSWFRRFIPNFAEISRPLSNLTKKNTIFKWSTKENEAFLKLKEKLISPPILQQVKEGQPFYLRTDASNYAIGAVLLQGEKEAEHPIEYASRLLLQAERNYSTTEREALAVVWAVQKFRGYIEGSQVTVCTDHQPLKWLLTLKSPTGRLARWSLLLQSYNLNIEYIPGRKNVVADTLSRPPCKNNICIESCDCNAVEIDFPHQGLEDFRKAQLEDEELKNIICSFENNDENVTRYINRGYIMISGVLYKYNSDQDSENGQLVIPKSIRQNIMQKYHNDPLAGHYGIEKTISRIMPLFYWPGIRNDIKKHVNACELCKKYKPTNMKPAGLLQTLSTNRRFEIIAVDLFGPLPKTEEGYKWILIVEDICSRWVELFALKDATAENCALTLLNEIILRYGVPRRLHTDNGTQFISALMQKLTYCLGIKQSFTAIYHPEANPVERKNRDLKTQLSICVGKDHTKWNKMLPAIRFAMNTAKCDSTGYSAAYLTFGRELRTPTEANYDFKSIVRAENFIPQITPHLLKLAETLEIANDAQIKMQDRNKHFTDRKRKASYKINVGDKVLVASHIVSKAKDGITSKFTPKRDGPYLVIESKGSSCFTIASLNAPNIPLATVHTSALFPFEGECDAPIYQIRKRGHPKNNQLKPKNKEVEENSDQSINDNKAVQNNNNKNGNTINLINEDHSNAINNQQTEKFPILRRSTRLKNRSRL